MKYGPIEKLLGLCTASCAALGLYSTPALAGPLTCTSTIVLSGAGNGFEADSSLGTGVCVQTADATFGNFNLAGLPAGGSVDFNVTNVGAPAVAYHGISFNDNFAAGTTYTMSYAVEITQGSNLFDELNADFTQTNGTSSLNTTTSQAGTGSIDFTKVGTQANGPDEKQYSPGFRVLDVKDVLVDGGSVSAISNDAIENKQVDIFEPQSAAVLLTGMAGVIFLSRRKRNTGNSAAEG